MLLSLFWVSYDVSFNCIDGRGSSRYVLSRTGAVGINNAKTDNDERYIRAYCSEEDNSERVWLYWMAGSSGAALFFCLFGTSTFVVGVFLFSSKPTAASRPNVPTVELSRAVPKYVDECSDKNTATARADAVTATDKGGKEAADRKDKNLKQKMLATMIAVPTIMFFFSVALLSCKLLNTSDYQHNFHSPLSLHSAMVCCNCL